jgi:hypothetical protein
LNRGSSPRRNRVNPSGQFEAVEARGSMLGNRGCLHDDTGLILSKAFRRTAWLTCELQFRGRRTLINPPGCYTQLFALDEATFLAAGHRPCALCRRPAFEAFRKAWQLAHGGPVPLAAEMDAELHRARIDGSGRQRTHTARLGDLPDGPMIELPGSSGRSALLWESQVHPWNHTGYGSPVDLDPLADVTVLTPRPTVAVLTAGYQPTVAFRRPPVGVWHQALPGYPVIEHGRP